MPKRTKPYREAKLARLSDPVESASCLNAAIEESEEDFPAALRDVAEANKVSAVATEAEVSRESVYRMLSEPGNTTYSGLNGILKALGLRMAITTAVIEPDADSSFAEPLAH